MASLPRGAEKVIEAADANEWETSATFAAGGAGAVKVDTWVVALEAYTTYGEVSLLLVWERDSRGAFRYRPSASRGTADWGRVDLQLKSIADLVESARVCERPEYGEGGCGCEDPEEVAFPRVCIEHAYFPEQGFMPRWGWGWSMTRNGDLAGWGEDGGTGGLYFTAIEGQEALTLADVVPEDVRKANTVVPGLPEPVDVGSCDVRVEAAFEGMCESVSVRLYRVGRQCMCAQHAAQRAGVAVSPLPVLTLDAEERRYAADLIEDDRQLRVFRGAEEWAEQQDAAGRTVPSGFERWVEENWTGDDYAAALDAWLRATGRATDPTLAWAVVGPVDRVEQSAVRLDTAKNGVQTARARHASAQRSMSREGIRRTRELDAAHAALADAERGHAAECAASGSDGAADAVVGARYRFGLATAGRRAVLVDGVLAGYVSCPFFGDWYAHPLHGRTTAHLTEEFAAEELVRWADRRAVEELARVRAEVSGAPETTAAGRSVTHAVRVGVSGSSCRSERVTRPHVTGCVTLLGPSVVAGPLRVRWARRGGRDAPREHAAGGRRGGPEAASGPEPSDKPERGPGSGRQARRTVSAGRRPGATGGAAEQVGAGSRRGGASVGVVQVEVGVREKTKNLYKLR
ncbi:hypothetical protein ACFU3J_25095 [Streptomyces sp. NPDC057411]|uniref:hypothetical protein n=1 Tax=unclassified Streptomyces TaxID=2593676 RepID=UPI00363624F0